MRFEKLSPPCRKLLLLALGYKKLKHLKCELCKVKVGYKKCCIMPSTFKDKRATILCDSPLCIAEWLEADINRRRTV